MSKAWLVFAAAVIVACGAYFAWQNFTPAPVDSTAANKAAPVADEAKAPEPAPTQAKPEERKTEAAAAPVDLTPTAAQTLAAPAPALVKTASVAGPGEFSVTLVARQLTWIRITADGAKVFGGTIEAGEQKVINAKDAAEVIVGNAGTLDVIYNGKPLQYGVKGEVKTLLFNNGGWKFKPKPAESTPTPATPATTGGSAGDIGLGI